jgi:iron complex transport system substrate-binding protein
MAVSVRAHVQPLKSTRGVVVAGILCGTLALAACGDDTDTTTSNADGDPEATAAADKPESPVPPSSFDNCGTEITVGIPPERVVTMNQASTEVMLALGLEDQLAGTAYLDDEIPAEWAEAYRQVPVLSDQYPSSETLLNVEPDAVYGAYPSAFAPDSGGERAELNDFGILTYLSPSACPDTPDDDLLDIETVWQEIREIGAIFGVVETADELIADQRTELDEAISSAPGLTGTTVMWWDGGTDVPSVGACCGAPGMIMAAAGVENAFGDVEGRWADASWEQVIERDPDVIVLVDADWSPATEKRGVIESTPAVRDLRAVQEGRFVVIPFSATTPGVRNVDAVLTLISEASDLK